VIAAGQDIDAVSEQLIGQRRRDAESARGVFAIGDGQMNVLGSDDRARMPRYQLPPGGSKNVADEKKVGYRSSRPV